MFTSWGAETTRKYDAKALRTALEELEQEKQYGMILRAKGIVEGTDGQWLHFDYIPGEADVRTGSAGLIGRICVIGSELKEDSIASLFRV